MVCLAGSLPARAADTATESRSCVPEVEPDDPNRLWLSWDVGDEDDLLPFLTLRFPAGADRSWRLDARLLFQGEEWTWSQELGEVTALTSTEVELDAAELLAWSVDQEDWTSTLLVALVQLNSEGAVVFRRSAPALRVVWVDGAPRLMTAEAEAVLAPQGAWTVAAREANPSATDTDSRNEFGGASGVETGGEE